MIFRPVPTDPDHDQDAEDAMFYRDTLQELVHIGTTLARLLQTQAIADAQATVKGMAPTTPLQDHAATFDRIARTIRRTITLARSLNEPVAPAKDPARPRAAARTPTLSEAGQGAERRCATPGRDDTAEAEAPSTDLRDRREAPDRDRPDRDEDDTNRPPAAVIADICRDLGLDTPPGADAWTRRTPADTMQPGARAVAPTSIAASCANPKDIKDNAVQHCSANSSPTDHKSGGSTPAEPAAIPRATGSTPAEGDAPDLVATGLHDPISLSSRRSPPPEG